MTSDHIGVRLLTAIFGLLAGVTCIGATVLAVMVVNEFSLGSWTSIAALAVLLGLLVAVNRGLVAVLLHLHERMSEAADLEDGLFHTTSSGELHPARAGIKGLNQRMFE